MKSGPDRFRDWMKRREINQREAAELLSTTDAFVSQLLNGQRNPSLANAVKIERVSGIPVESWLVSELSGTDAGLLSIASKRSLTRR